MGGLAQGGVAVGPSSGAGRSGGWGGVWDICQRRGWGWLQSWQSCERHQPGVDSGFGFLLLGAVILLGDVGQRCLDDNPYVLRQGVRGGLFGHVWAHFGPGSFDVLMQGGECALGSLACKGGLSGGNP